MDAEIMGVKQLRVCSCLMRFELGKHHKKKKRRKENELSKWLRTALHVECL